MATELKLSASGFDERKEEIVEAVKGLEKDDKLTLSCGDDFFGVISAVQRELKNEFIWAPLVNGPRMWKGEIRRFAPEDVIHGSIVAYMTFDHKRCDELYADAEAAWNDGDEAKAMELLRAFDLGMKRHLGEEENVLFPLFTEATGMVGGPVQVMTMEHEQMRGVLSQMQEALDANDLETAIANGDTMVILMQQHNVKEEGILYPMIEQHAPGDSEETIRTLQTYLP
ncbi:MAG: hemerythrin domain-containing protein [Deltaproteobacteria bacterium]|nr:hemerythrin domain-containing protein [Deltaproteobacteria bacterium]